MALVLQDRLREGAFTFSLLPSEIAFILSIIYDNLVTMKDYFSMLKSSKVSLLPLEQLTNTIWRRMIKG